MDNASIRTQAESMNVNAGSEDMKKNGVPQGSELMPVANSKDWSSGLFSCHPRTCATLDEWMCWPCVSCRLAVLVGENCLCACRARTRLRNKYGIKGTEAEDACLFTWCGMCTLNQMLREIEALTDHSTSDSLSCDNDSDSASGGSVVGKTHVMESGTAKDEANKGHVVMEQPREPMSKVLEQSVL